MVNSIQIRQSKIKISKEKSLEIESDYKFTPGIYKLTGANGSGKSIFLEYLSGFKQSRNISCNIERANILYLGETGLGVEDLTILENIKLIYWIFGLHLDDGSISKVEALYTKEQLNTIYSQASFGMQIMVGLSLLFSQKHWQLIVLDETLSGVDVNNKSAIIRDIHEKLRECIIFFVSHGSIDELNESKEVMIADGKVLL